MVEILEPSERFSRWLRTRPNHHHHNNSGSGAFVVSRQRKELYDVTIRIVVTRASDVDDERLAEHVRRVATECWAISGYGLSIRKEKKPLKIVKKRQL